MIHTSSPSDNETQGQLWASNLWTAAGHHQPDRWINIYLNEKPENADITARQRDTSSTLHQDLFHDQKIPACHHSFNKAVGRPIPGTTGSSHPRSTEELHLFTRTNRNFGSTLFRFGTNGQEEITCDFIEKADGNFTPISSDDSNTELEFNGVATQ